MAIFHKYPYTDFHDLNLDWIIELCKKIQELLESTDFEHIQEELANLKSEVLTHSEEIEALKNVDIEFRNLFDTIDTTIRNIMNTDARQDTDIDNLENAITGLESAIPVIENRISNLEGIAFEGVSVAPIPRTFAMDWRNGTNRNFKIKYLDGTEATGSDEDSIVWVDSGRYTTTGSTSEPNTPLNTYFKIPSFKRTGTPCYLEIPFIYPYLYSSYRVVNPTLYFFIQRYISATDTTAPSAGITATLRDFISGVKRETAQNDYWNDVQFVLNQNTGWYDMRLYNGRDNLYSSSNDHRETSFIISESLIFPSGSSETARRQAYYASYSSAERQIEGLISNSYSKSEVENLIAETETNIYSTVTRTVYNRTSAIYPLSFSPNAGVTITSNKSHYDAQSDGYGYSTIRCHVDLSLTVANLLDEDMILGNFSYGTLLNNLDGSFNQVVQPQRRNQGSYGNISGNSNLTVRVYLASGESTENVKLRITGEFYKVDNP